MLFLVDIFHISCGTHHAHRIVTMFQSERVAQFVNDHFQETLKKQFFISGQAILFISETVGGGYPSFALINGLPEKESQDRNKKVNVEKADGFNGFVQWA